MSYTLASTKWPSFPISEATKQLVGSLFSTLDDTSNGAGDRLADEIFATEGVFEGIHPVKGTEGMYTPMTTSLRSAKEVEEAHNAASRADSNTM